MGDKETGLSIFWTDAGIDTGPILLQKRVPIDPEDTTGSLYFNRLFPLGVEAIAESVDLIKAGRAPRLVQDESLATYEPLCNDQVARIDWERPRGRGPQPHPGLRSPAGGLLHSFRGKRSASSMPGAAMPFRPPGRGKSSERMRMDSPWPPDGGTIRIGKVRTDAGKQDAAAFAAQRGLKSGDSFTKD